MFVRCAVWRISFIVGVLICLYKSTSPLDSMCNTGKRCVSNLGMVGVLGLLRHAPSSMYLCCFERGLICVTVEWVVHSCAVKVLPLAGKNAIFPLFDCNHLQPRCPQKAKFPQQQQYIAIIYCHFMDKNPVSVY